MKYSEEFKREIVQKYEFISPKPKQDNFAKQHQVNLNSFQNWLHEFRARYLLPIRVISIRQKPGKRSSG